MKLTPAQLVQLRKQPHKSTMYLSIYSPTIIFAAQVNNASIAKDARTIAYNNVTVGAYTDIFPNAQMVVANNSSFKRTSIIGTIRVRSATATEITVAENSHINWEDDLYFRILNYVDVEAIYPRIIPDPADEENVIFYKDYDIAYTNQNDILGTFVCAGPHRAGWAGEQQFWSASGTYNVDGESLTYLWEFEGGTPGSAFSHTPGLVTYNQPGHYKTTLTVTSDSGRVDRAYRFVSVYDRPEVGGVTPVQKWEISDINGSRSSGGYSARVKIRDDISLTEVHDNSLVVIFSDDWYGGVQGSLGGNAINASSIFFVGYVMKGSISYNYIDNYIEFDIGSVTEVMKQAEGFSVSCESKANPATWFEIKNMTVPKALFHYLRWHSTVLRVADFEYTGDARSHQYFDTDRSSLYDAVSSFMASALIGEVVADRQGKIWAEISASATPFARGSFPLALSMTNGDWIGTPVLEERHLGETSFIEMGGVVFGATGSSALLSNAPGETPAYRGRAKTIEGLILSNQTQLNRIAGSVYAFENAPFPSLSLEMKGNYSNLDIAPIERITVDLAAADTPRRITFSNEPFYPIAMSWRYDPITQVRLPTLELGQLVNGANGDTIVVPPIPEGGFTNPPTTNPPTFPGGGGGGGMNTSPLAWYAWFDGDGTPVDYQEELRGMTIDSISYITNLDLDVYFKVPSDGWYVAGCYGTVWKGDAGITGDGFAVAISMPDNSPIYFPPISNYVPQQNMPFINSLSPPPTAGGAGSIVTLLYVRAGDRVSCDCYTSSSANTLKQYYAWCIKISD